MRPLDAYGALAYLRTRADVVADRIGLHGWSNGASATLAAMTGIGVPGGAKATPGDRLPRRPRLLSGLRPQGALR